MLFQDAPVEHRHRVAVQRVGVLVHADGVEEGVVLGCARDELQLLHQAIEILPSLVLRVPPVGGAGQDDLRFGVGLLDGLVADRLHSGEFLHRAGPVGVGFAVDVGLVPQDPSIDQTGVLAGQAHQELAPVVVRVVEGQVQVGRGRNRAVAGVARSPARGVQHHTHLFDAAPLLVLHQVAREPAVAVPLARSFWLEVGPPGDEPFPASSCRGCVVRVVDGLDDAEKGIGACNGRQRRRWSGLQ